MSDSTIQTILTIVVVAMFWAVTDFTLLGALAAVIIIGIIEVMWTLGEIVFDKTSDEL